MARSAKRKFTLRFYDNRPLKRFTGLFSRSTQIQIKELENADIDIYSSVQVRGRGVAGIQPLESQVELPGSDKIYAEYLGVNGGDEDFSAMNILEQRNDSVMSNMNCQDENSMRVMFDSVMQGDTIQQT